MLSHLCVAFSPSPPGRFALAHAVALARRTGARVTIVHVANPPDERLDEPPSVVDELLPVREDVRCRQRLAATLAPLTAGIDTDLRVVTGPMRSTMLEVVWAIRPDLVVAGVRVPRGLRRLRSAPLQDTLLAAARCPVVLVRSPPREPNRIVVTLASGGSGDDILLRVAGKLGDDLGAAVVEHPAPAHARDTAGILAAAAASQRHRPLLTVLWGERLPGVRRRLALGTAEALGKATPWPILVVPRRFRAAGARDTYRVRNAPRSHPARVPGESTTATQTSW